MTNSSSSLDPNQPMAPPPAPETPAVEPGPEPSRSRALLTFGLILVGAALLIFAATRYSSRQSVGNGPVAAPLKGEGTGQPAPNFTVKDIHGNTFKLSDLRGKVVILDFWATWCAPCKVEIPWFIDMYDHYKAQGLEVVGVSMDDDTDGVKPFAEKYNMNYRVVLGNDSVATLFGGIFGLPTTFVIGRDGKIESRHLGLVSRDTIEQSVKKLL